MQRLLVFFGGVTTEHEVSVITGLQLLRHADPAKYELTPVYIDKAGQWWTGSGMTEPGFFSQLDLFKPAGLQPFSLQLNRGSNPYDVAILCFHGGYGEAGNVQGALELAGIPYQGPAVTSSAICFDKVVTRQILAAEKLPQTPYVWFTSHDWDQRQTECQSQVDQLTYPVFVKPANSGSTIGIERVTSAAELPAAIASVRQYDQRILVEAEVKDCIEVNVSVVGLTGDTRASVPEQPIKVDEFLSYADKYQRGGGKKSGMASASRRIPAPISSSLTLKLQELAQHVFQVMDCSGVVRIDFFVDPSEESIFITELNTIPGSMSYYLWEASDLPYRDLIDRLVEIAMTRHGRQQELITSYPTNILQTSSEV